jgi:predicted ATPase
MATPGADIRLVEESAIRSVAFDEVEHVRVTRDFLNAPERYLRQL